MPDGLQASTQDDIEKRHKKAIGARLGAELKRADITPTQLAEGVGVAQTTIARYIAGRMNINAVMVRRIADYLGCDPAAFFADASDEVVA